ncbi:nuclear pore complex protein Nup58-like [Phlebotomus papatasi]|uniref:nuclear pore complex protein Nup58-like n=1 Tax=Phlebotomus papatasi TaxID=29031 RepID=UPI00248430CB|nr:nuclear pore complex protein Nup58-like [Phlebotomus papatasi]
MSKFGFGTPTTTQPGAPGAPSFGTTTSVPSFGGFGATPAPNPTTQAGFSFGTTPAASSTGLSFGATPQPQASFGFGAPQATSAPLNFGTPTPAAPSVPSLGGFSGLAATAAKPTPTTLSFPQTFGTNPTTSAPTLSFNAPTTSIGLNFGAPTATTSAPLFNFNTSTQPQAQPPGLLGAKTTGASFSFPAQSTTGVFGGVPTATTATTTQSVGLGGVDIATQPKTTEGTDAAKIKEAQLPQEIVVTVKGLEDHIKEQRKSSDIARNFDQKLKKVENETESVRRTLSEISNKIVKNYSAIKQLKAETNEAIQNAEMAQRTHETPNGLQFENTAPLKYFLDIIQKYENEMIVFRNQVELTEKHMYSLMTPQNSTADDLKRGLHQIHESFIALAGRLHEIHQRVEAQKEHYLNIRKFYLKDFTDVFEEAEKRDDPRDLSKISKGPTPFSTLTSINLGQTGVPHSAPNTQSGTSFGGLFGSSGGMSGGSSFFGGGSGGLFPGTTNESSFNLQKPPLGNKRNKP